MCAPPEAKENVMQTIKPSDYFASELAAEFRSRIKELERNGIDWQAWVKEDDPASDEVGMMLCLEFNVTEEGNQPDFETLLGFICTGDLETESFVTDGEVEGLYVYWPASTLKA